MTLKWYGDKAKKQIDDLTMKAVTGMAADSVKQAKANASQPKGSAQHPQRQTGTLVRAIIMDVFREVNRIIAKVGIMKSSESAAEALEYAEPLEFGTNRHPPYPYLFPAVELITKKAKEYFR